MDIFTQANENIWSFWRIQHFPAGKTKSMTFREMFIHSGLHVPEILCDGFLESIYISGI